MKSVLANCALQLARCSMAVVPVVVLVAGIFAWQAPRARASDLSDPNDHLSFCNFGPKVTIVRDTSDTSDTSATSSSNPCIARVHVQAVLWKCGSAENVATNSANFLSKLNNLAQQECSKYCESLGSGCVSNFSNIPECGLGTDRETAVALGKSLGCRSDCTDGKAFTYCSLFNAGFNGLGTYALQADPINCECRSRS